MSAGDGRDGLTPMQRQYLAIRRELPADMILFYRLGDFYEMFFEDAKRASSVLGVALTQRGGIPLCGVPFHAVEGYLAKAIRAGIKVAICEQTEDPKSSKGLVKREITRIVTPGTVTEESILAPGAANYISSVLLHRGVWAMAVADLSTGDIFTESFSSLQSLVEAFMRYSPKECIIGEEASREGEAAHFLSQIAGVTLTKAEDWTFSPDAAGAELLSHYGVSSLDGFGIAGHDGETGAAGALMRYLKNVLLRNTSHFRPIRHCSSSEYLVLDEATCRNLDLVPSRGREKDGTLLGILDSTSTPMGARELRQLILRPCSRKAEIEERQEGVAWFVSNRLALFGVRDALLPVRDMERLLSRIVSGLGNGRDVKALELSLRQIAPIKERIAQAGAPLLRAICSRLGDFSDLVGLLGAAICDSPPVSLREGGIIRDGYSAELDEFRRLAKDGKSWLAEYQTREQARTGIKTLKVRYNKVFGFYIEISKSFAAMVPAEYERRQTLVGAERFITTELKEYEQKIVGAQDKAYALEYEIFASMREKISEAMAEIQKTANAVSLLDVTAALADRALAYGYVRPEIADGDALFIEQGRHPVVEQMDGMERFVPNDANLDCRENQIAVITGPNMAGKSTYIRQVAVLSVMAHMGSFIPAKSAKIPVMDRVFTRVGAGDDLARGRSTFMVEMQETANILNCATPKSLIVLDEIGRGTSTFDGISIAWAVAEYLHNTPSVKAKTLFATHYHELTELESELRGVKNYSVQIRESGEQIVFLRTVARGYQDKSYGISVARLAGIPPQVIGRAREILGNLEENAIDSSLKPKLAAKTRKNSRQSAMEGQLSLF